MNRDFQPQLQKLIERDGRSGHIKTLLMVSFWAIAGGVIGLPVQALPKSSLPIPSQIAVNPEDVVVSGEKGNYVVRLFVNSSKENVWKILTGYTELSRFMPDVISSKVIESKGSQKILDQVYSSAYTLGLKAKVRLQVTESYLKGLNIELVKADYLRSFHGTWTIEKAPNRPKQLLLTHAIKIDPKIDFGKDIFYQFYREGLEETMIRLKKEIESGS
jgi:hypothetical protein